MQLLLDLETESVANLLCDMERKKLETEVTRVAEHRAALEREYEEKLRNEVAKAEERVHQKKRKSFFLDGVAQTDIRSKCPDVGIQCSIPEPLLTDAWVQSDHLHFTGMVACQTEGSGDPGMLYSRKSAADIAVEDNFAVCSEQRAKRTSECISSYNKAVDEKCGCGNTAGGACSTLQRSNCLSSEEQVNMNLERNTCIQGPRGSASHQQDYNSTLQESLQLRCSHESLIKPHCNGYETPPAAWDSEQVAWNRYGNGTDCSSVLGSATPGCRSSWHSLPGSCRLVDGSASVGRDPLTEHNHDYRRRNSMEMGSDAQDSFSHPESGNMNMVNRWHSPIVENQPNDLCYQHSSNSRIPINSSKVQQNFPHKEIKQVPKTTSWRSHSPELSDSAYSARCSHSSDYHHRRSQTRPFENPIFQLRRSQEIRQDRCSSRTSMQSKQDLGMVRAEGSNGNLSHGDDLAEYSDCSSVLHCNEYHESVLRGLRWSERINENNAASCDRYGDSYLRNSGSFASTPTNQSFLSTPKAETGAISPTLPAPERSEVLVSPLMNVLWSKCNSQVNSKS